MINFAKYNLENEDGYYFSPFSPQRRTLRSTWSGATDWDEYLYFAEEFNNRYKDCYPKQGDAPLHLILEKVANQFPQLKTKKSWT